MTTQLRLVLGYSDEIEEDSPHGKWLKQLFGRFLLLRFHLEETSDTTVRLTVEGTAPLGQPGISERFGGTHESRHRTKNGNFFDMRYHDKCLRVSPYVMHVIDEQSAAVA